MCVWGGGGRERVCVCVDRFIVECPPTYPPLPPSVYLALRANDQVRRSINIHLHYITLQCQILLTVLLVVVEAFCSDTVLMICRLCVSVQCVFFGALAITTLRMKYLWTPYMCVLSAAAIGDSQMWGGVLALVKSRTAGLVSF